MDTRIVELFDVSRRRPTWEASVSTAALITMPSGKSNNRQPGNIGINHPAKLNPFPPPRALLAAAMKAN